MTQHRTTEWTPQALELFAAYAPHREPYRPRECQEWQYAQCWVRDGPPSMAKAGTGIRCTGCRGTPLPPLNRRKSP